MLRIVTLLSVRRESGWVLAPQLVTQWVPAWAGAGASNAAASAASMMRFIVCLPKATWWTR